VIAYAFGGLGLSARTRRLFPEGFVDLPDSASAALIEAVRDTMKNLGLTPIDTQQ
jgi:hypothetical protein